jgi:putative DNA primase/helicase
MGGDQQPASPPGGNAPPSSSELLAAALAYAARGWPVFPCNPKNKQPLLAAKKDAANKPIKGTGGVSAASTDPDQVTAWWKKWPQALIGLACGHPTKGTETLAQPAGLCLFVLDFDPRADLDTGEVWTLERLKRETEEQLGCALPVSMAALTPSDGVHLYLLKGDDGPAITNRGNLPQHVDVRGLGGYVIAPPSVMGPNAAKGQSGLRYRWHRREPIGGIAKAPERLLEVLRERGGKGVPSETSTGPPKVSSAPKSQQALTVDDAVRKYALSALDGECRELAATPIGGGQWGGRNQGIYHAALKLGTLAGAGALSESTIRAALGDVVRSMPHNDDIQGALQTLENGLAYGVAHPRDLSEIAEAARQRRERPPPASGHHRPPPSSAAKGRQSSRSGGAGFEAEERGRGGDGEPDSGELTRKCAFHPLTDLGNLERFLERFGRDFLFVEAWGWLAWDGRRWNREMALRCLPRRRRRRSARFSPRLISSE